MMFADIDTEKYIKSSRDVHRVVHAPYETVYRIAEEQGYSGAELADRIAYACEYACTYALRDVMTIMNCGYSLDEALRMWVEDDGALGMRGECMNAVAEAFEDDEEED